MGAKSFSAAKRVFPASCVPLDIKPLEMVTFVAR